MIYMELSSKALVITGADDQRYWQHMPTSESRTESMSLSPQAVAIFSKLLSWCRTFSTNKKAAERSWNRSDCEDATLVSATFRNIPWIRRRERIESAVSTKCFGRKKRKGPGSGHNWGPTVDYGMLL
ncbi:unnamed protein product [Urochloa humidicola]